MTLSAGMHLTHKIPEPRSGLVVLLFDPVDTLDLPHGKASAPTMHFSATVTPEQADGYTIGRTYELSVPSDGH